MTTISDLLVAFWNTSAEMAPYLLLGFAVAGLLSALVSARWIERHMGGRGVAPVVKATIFGVPLPLCSCGVIPVAASLRRSGASRGATTGFLLSTPQTGVDSILVTWSLLGPFLAIFRPVAALVTGIAGGAVASILDRRPESQGAGEETAGEKLDAAVASCSDGCGPVEEVKKKSWREALSYGFVSLPQDIGRSLLIGLGVAAVITVLLPPEVAGRFGTGFMGLFGMMLIGIPIYVCATGSVPIAAALMMKGISPGAALVFLVTGPATNAATIATIHKVLGRRTLFVYLGTVVVAALGSGMLVDALLPTLGKGLVYHEHEMGPGLFEHLSALALFGMLGYALTRKRGAGEITSEEGANALQEEAMSDETLTLSIGGMSCNHCVQSVHRALSSAEGVSEVSVRLEEGAATVRGQSLDRGRLEGLIESLGFEVRPQNA